MEVDLNGCSLHDKILSYPVIILVPYQVGKLFNLKEKERERDGRLHMSVYQLIDVMNSCVCVWLSYFLLQSVG